MAECSTSRDRWEKKRKGSSKANGMREAKCLKKLQEEQVWEVQSEQSEAENHSAIVSEISSPVARPQVEEESVGGQREMEDPDGEAEEELIHKRPLMILCLLLLEISAKCFLCSCMKVFIAGKSMMDAARESASITGLLIIF